MLTKVLVANRGEIAVRVIRACREVGARAVAVFSEADRTALHVRLADEAYPVGEAAAAKSYLDIAKIVDVGRKAGCDAVHPGYGFLSENDRFAGAVEAAGMRFIGPTPENMRLMGDKLAARREAVAAGVPIVPGSSAAQAIADERELAARASEIGFPLMIKAAAGGGGKGIRVVRAEEELVSSFRLASSEALSAFGDPRVYVERFLSAARHIEVQVLGDGAGGVVHLGERECSLQRRHQKLVEESPSPSIGPELRRRICEAAVALARRVRYRNAGTCEFLVPRADGDEFFFMEMNTRLQVEHPVTELVTGLDLVREQLRIAAGEPLGYGQEAVRFRGAAIEARIYAEDPANGFVPSAGVVGALRLPGGPHTRVDTALCAGERVTLHYDPLVAKLVVWGETRGAAVARLRRALAECVIGGIRTTVPFLATLAATEEFERADFHIHFLEPWAKRLLAPSPQPSPRGAEGAELGPEQMAALAAVLAVHVGAAAQARGAPSDGSRADANGKGSEPTPWARLGRAMQLHRRSGGGGGVS